MKTLFLIRGLPSSGKSTKAKEIFKDSSDAEICEADQYFIDEETGEYKFDPSKLSEAHKACREKVKDAMSLMVDCVIVSNTSTRLFEYQVYLDMAKQYGYKVNIINIFDGGKTDEELAKRNVHRVPLEVIKAMRARWEENHECPNCEKDNDMCEC
jgi:predicted kinase